MAPWFSMEGYFAPHPPPLHGGYLAITPDIFFTVTKVWKESDTGLYWVETKEAPKYPTMHRRAHTTETYLAQKVNSPEIERPWINSIFI